MKNKINQYKGDLMLLLVALIWGLGFVAVKIGLEGGMPPFFLLMCRFTIAFLGMLPIFYKQILKLDRATWISGSILGGLLFLGFAFQTFGLMYTTTSKNAFLTGVNVVIVPFFAWFITKKKPDYYALAASVICLMGIGFLTLDGTMQINTGDLLTLVCALMFAGHIAYTSQLSQKINSGLLVMIQMLVAGILSMIMFLMLGEKAVLNTTSSIAIIYLGVFSTLIAFYLQTLGQKYANATKAAILLASESLFGAIFAVIIFGDLMSPLMLIGCILIFSAIIISETKLDFRKNK